MMCEFLRSAPYDANIKGGLRAIGGRSVHQKDLTPIAQLPYFYLQFYEGVQKSGPVALFYLQFYEGVQKSGPVLLPALNLRRA